VLSVSGPLPLRVGLNLLWLGERAGGVGRYACELPGALLEAEPATEITVYVGSRPPAQLRDQPWADSVHWKSLPVTADGVLTQLAEHAILPGLAAAARLDVLHSPANTGPVIIPGSASVVSLMDLIWLHHGDEWNPDRQAQRAMRRQVVYSVRRAGRIFAISETAAKEIVTGLAVPRSRIVVTPLGVAARGGSARPEAEVRDRLDLGQRRVVLCVAQHRRYKNLAQIIRALPALPDDVIAVLPGAPTPYGTELRELAADFGVGDRLRWPQWISEADLEALYGLADAFVLPTLSEGFGLPLLEAMTYDLPVACSDIPVLREVAGDAALYFDPHNADAVSQALSRLLDDDKLRKTLCVRGRERVREFTWRRTGEASLHGYREAITARGRT
jgi:glycosyltransferase involved in cell wall biosynthesis